ncbi:hypothetical protein L7F22_037710 [Adiantum nelumboides]|nr:hypothetical protein [Adiantum nelumboides]
MAVPLKKKAPKPMEEIMKFAQKMIETSDVCVDVKLNKHLWSWGIRNVPKRVRIRIARKRNVEEDLYSYVRGSGGVAVLYKEELHPIIQIVKKDTEARYLWIRVQTDDHCPIYIAVCYFAPSNSVYANPQGESPYSILDEDIFQYSKLGEVLVVGDFNVRKYYCQASFFDTSTEDFSEYDQANLGIERFSKDKGICTTHGKYLLEMGIMHALAILNGMARWPRSGELTCYTHRNGTSIVDYVLAPLALIPHIQDFSISPRLLGAATDHAYLSFTLECSFSVTQFNTHQQSHSYPRYHFSKETEQVYASQIFRLLVGVDPHIPLVELTQQFTVTLHATAKTAFPHSRGSGSYNERKDSRPSVASCELREGGRVCRVQFPPGKHTFAD